VVLGEGVLRLLDGLGAGTGALLVLEDMHWADPESLEVVEYLVDHAAEVRLTCVVTARPGRSTGLARLDAVRSRRVATLIELPPLSPDEVAVMTAACLRTNSLPAGLDDLVARADGVPFLVEELLAAAAEVGVVANEAGRWVVRPAPRLWYRVPSPPASRGGSMRSSRATARFRRRRPCSGDCSTRTWSR
jgi:hypothetical protein